MTFTQIFSLLAMATHVGFAQKAPDTFDLKVERIRILRNQPGDLHIDTRGITFRSRDGKASITIRRRICAKRRWPIRTRYASRPTRFGKGCQWSGANTSFALQRRL